MDCKTFDVKVQENSLNKQQKEALIEFVNNIGIVKLDESNVFGKYFAKKSKVEQAKIIVDKFVAYIEDEEMYELPKKYYDLFVENISFLEESLKKGTYPTTLREIYLEECIENGKNALKKLSILKPLTF